MIGISCYSDSFDKEYISKAKEIGVEFIYTSLIYAHKRNQISNAFDMIDFVHSLGLKIIVDCDQNVLDVIAYVELLKHKIDGIRFDELNDNIFRIISELNKKVDIYLNASTCSKNNINSLSSVDVKFLYNFYPLKETGLSSDCVKKINEKIIEEREVGAFIPGDEYRGPIHQGLPTIEKHRFINPYVAGCDLYIENKINHVIVGDIKINLSILYGLIKLIKSNTILLPIYYYGHKQCISKIILRDDNSEALYRSRNRIDFEESQFKSCFVKRGTIFKYSKGNNYHEFIFISKKDLLLDEKVSLIGFINPYFENLIDLNISGKNIVFVDDNYFN